MGLNIEGVISDDSVKFCFDHVKNLCTVSLILYAAALILVRAYSGNNIMKIAVAWVVMGAGSLLGLVLEANFVKNLYARTGLIATVGLCAIELLTFAALIAQPVLAKIYS